MKKSNNSIGKRTRDLPACSAVPQNVKHVITRTGNGKSIKGYKGSRGTAPLTPNFGIRLSRVVNFTTRSRTGRFGEDKNLFFLPRFELWFARPVA